MPRPTKLKDPWLSLSIKFGGVAKLAEEFGVHTGTLRRWNQGLTKINGPAKRLLDYLMADLEIGKPNASIPEVDSRL